MSNSPSGVFGAPPKDLSPFPSGARQTSPLLPGSANLELLEPGCLHSFTLLAPPGTIERRYTLALALRALAPAMPLVALAPKDKGGSRLKKELESFGCVVEEDSRQHHKICSTVNPGPNEAQLAAIAEGAPRFDEKLGFHTQPGIFSWDRVDPGSAMLAPFLPELSGSGADLGCGFGYLSREILKSPKVRRLALIDVDRRAIDCARKNLEKDEARVHLLWADLRTAETSLSSLDFIVTNPPFHDAGAEDQSLGQGFLQQAAYLLRPMGTLWLVANRHLPYEALLRSLFQEVSLLKEDGGFKVYKAVR